MDDSTTYQEIIEKGEARGMERGRVAEAREIIYRFGTKKFGAPDPEIRGKLEAIGNINLLEAIIDRLLDASLKHWDELI